MTMGQQKDRQGDLMVGWAEMPRSPGHVFYDRLQSVLIEGGFDGFAEAGLVKGERIGVDASTMEANAALRNIVRRDTGEGYRGMLARLAQESGIETPTAEDLARLDRKRKGKKLSNQDWVSKSDPEAKIAKMKDGTTHLAYKPEHAVDLDTGAVVAAELHPADEGDTTTLEKTLAAAKENLEAVDAAPTAEDPAECVTDKGYHSRSVLKALEVTAPGRRGSPSPSRKVLRAGTATGRPAGQSPTTGPGCYRAWPRKPSSCAPRSSSAPLRTTSIAAACAGHGCAGARTCTSDTCSMSPATI